MIKELAIENKSLKKELSKQSKIVNEATKYQKERDSIIFDNRTLHNRVAELEDEYKNKFIDLKFKYEHKYRKLEKENNKWHNIICYLVLNILFILLKNFVNIFSLYSIGNLFGIMLFSSFLTF